ncbi:U3 small nucleolar RNA-associated protein 18 homolog isoform X2 [Orussus abietinus]|uniref:U3 small nucleolar RNA-associated protein 18 homolog isoform X2 n=1 Tax=Orussus abietinus TaxID=222816 RepID=UPI0006261D5D|nr:U3 small nucleolar RNA-associated protein 18 homolog isoform X2 [Orussus abietinus]
MEFTKRKTRFNEKTMASLKKRKRSAYNREEEARLEKLVLGVSNNVICHLSDDDTSLNTKQTTLSIDLCQNEKNEKRQDIGTENNTSETEVYVENTEAEFNKKKEAAWVDNDASYSVSTALALQRRTLPGQRPEKSYAELLQNKMTKVFGTPKWAELDRDNEIDLDDVDSSILKHSNHLLPNKKVFLPKTTLEIKALARINKQTQNEGYLLSDVQFHPTSTVALVAGNSGVLSIFQVDGKENEKLHSMRYERFPINTARFLKDGTQIIVGSKMRNYCHSYDLITGKTFKIPLPHAMTNMKKFQVSPDGKLIAVCGRMGEVHLLTGDTKELVDTLKMNKKCYAVAFSPDSRTLFSHGDGGVIYSWDMTSRRCINHAIDEGCLCGSAIAISPSGQIVATGSKQGVVNFYDLKDLTQKQVPTPLKVILNLVTPITSLRFNSTSEILAMASDDEDNAVRLVHLPSFTVFSNFPTFQTKLHKTTAMDFSPNSGFFSIANNNGIAYLYRLKHYENY